MACSREFQLPTKIDVFNSILPWKVFLDQEKDGGPR